MTAREPNDFAHRVPPRRVHKRTLYLRPCRNCQFPDTECRNGWAVFHNFADAYPICAIDNSVNAAPHGTASSHHQIAQIVNPASTIASDAALATSNPRSSRIATVAHSFAAGPVVSRRAARPGASRIHRCAGPVLIPQRHRNDASGGKLLAPFRTQTPARVRSSRDRSSCRQACAGAPAKASAGEDVSSARADKPSIGGLS
jgi:hypothetical protein